ncbi:HAAS signaling domain-containing protein [Rheinheimera sp.]|uniref:HAAS signaling domain-containing protein n=1 Tax=Rheinheimera sp. TaxID=1869214 RepID=UPI002FDDEF52
MQQSALNNNDSIHRYLNDLRRYLARLAPHESQEVIREIESHLFDVIEQQEATGNSADVAAILRGFGEPRQLAAQYIAHIEEGAPPPRGFKAIQSMKKSVTATLYFAMAVFGFSTAMCLLFVAGAKFLLPESVGVWSTPHGNSIVVGFVSVPPMAMPEVMGWWIVPAAAILALAVALLTRKVLSVLKQHM